MLRPLVLFAVLAAPLVAQDAQPARDHAITIDDYASLATITALAVSPDGTQVAYCEGRWDRADDARKTDLWVVSTDGKGKPRRLTGERANDRQPKWAADGKSVFVLANRRRAGETNAPHDGTTQIWRVALDGSDPKPMTRIAGGVAGYDYAPKADAVFYATDTSATDEDSFSGLRAKYATPEYGHGKRKTSEIHKLDLATWRVEKVVGEGRYVREFAVSADGQRVAMITAMDDTVIRSEGGARVDVWDAAVGKVVAADESWRKTAASPWPWLENLAWAPDGKRLAFCSIFDAHPAEVIIHTLQGTTWTAERMKRPDSTQVHGYGSPIKWMSDSRYVFIGEDSGSAGTLPYDISGKLQSPPVEAGSVVSVFDIENSTSAQSLGSPTKLPRLMVQTGFDPVPPIDLNPHTKTWKVPSLKHLTWKAPDGTEVGGVLELPPGYKKGDKLPLVVGIHGGPTTSSTAALNYDALNGRLYFAAHGYAALYPNYRGSTGYGDKFVTDLIGNENDIEVKDILAGIQHLIKEGIADPDRVGVCGWSNGGYLTNCLITLKDSPVQFKAASSGAGILDTVAEWGFNDEPAYPTVFKKGLPWETPDIYRKTSPTYGLGNVTTPTLIHVGANDERCPPGHSRMLYRALREYKKVPTELVVYPGEPHGLMKLSHRLAKMEWDLAWFDKYLMGKK